MSRFRHSLYGNKELETERFPRRKQLMLKGLRLQACPGPEYLAHVDMFELVGETLRRLRKERHMTLAQLGLKAELGRGQLSRIENGHQEATLGTVAKILNAQGVSRREFFRRYDLVENERLQVDRSGAAGERPYPTASGGQDLPGEIRETIGRFESFVQGVLHQSPAVAQGAVELGDFVILFRIVPRGSATEIAPPSTAAPLAHATPATATSPAAPAPAKPERKRGRRKKR
jgi:transcriptional regulator with XRE-family HTH domain